MPKWPYYPMYVDEFDNSEAVQAMADNEVGIYILCLNSSWKVGSLADDPELVAVAIRRRASGVKKAWKAVRACYMDRGDGRLVNPYQETIRAQVQGKSSKASAAANARWQAMRTHKNNDASALQEPDANAVPRAFVSVSVFEESKKTTLPPPAAPPIEFSENDAGHWANRWYDRHPKKRDLVLVFPVVARMIQRGVDMQAVDAAHEALCQSPDWTKQGGRFCPKLAEWLEDRGWMSLAVVQQEAVPEAAQW